MADEKPMNIYQKLIEVRKCCNYLKKDAQGFNFQYVSSSQTLGTLRDKMNDMGLLLIPRVIDYEVRDHKTDKGKHNYFSIFKMTFTWVNADNPEEIIVCEWTGHGLDDAEKGVGKAVTYAEKYFFLKFFNIPTDKEDPDSFQERHTPQEDRPQQATPTKQPKDWAEWVQWQIVEKKTVSELDDFRAGISDKFDKLSKENQDNLMVNFINPAYAKFEGPQ
jgi:hypothetical protein